jgi:hypothetical protein
MAGLDMFECEKIIKNRVYPVNENFLVLQSLGPPGGEYAAVSYSILQLLKYSRDKYAASRSLLIMYVATAATYAAAPS